MEKQLKCVLLLSLKEMALRRVAVLLWSDSDILASISKFQMSEFAFDKTGREWRVTIEDKIKDKMFKLKLPESLTKQMIVLIRPNSLEIRRWKKSHEYYLWMKIREILPNSAKPCWTTAGTIDNKKTAEKLVRCYVLDVVERYELACLYCLEDGIPLLWEKVPEEKKVYCSENNYSTLPFCWPHILKGELSKLN
ncbi:hypothetical protein AVEN_122091-1 [Araneus ventricosus]|uniref:Uncharacterized protein n=1 Tax=Araneus ventricosus TaxID=182803 RepID=A0A4Y2SC61_ARAVE|nr:hypothetical protein AVEN_122091-1 [Araneus ventricosus]